MADRDAVERIYDQRFVRMWEFYLAAAEMSFREQNLMVFQIQLTKRQDVVPMTRNYITREQERLSAAERNQRPLL
jgi:cyclopropane-fatty-acyl-phospholipid synthase